MKITALSCSWNACQNVMTTTVILHIFFNDENKWIIKANCPLGCPCENYDCDNSGSDDDDTININGPITIQENNFISELEYRNDFEVSFEFKASSIPSNQFHEIIIGKMTFFYNSYIQIDFEASINGGTATDTIMFAMWCGKIPNQYDVYVGSWYLFFSRELVADKWYKVCWKNITRIIF